MERERAELANLYRRYLDRCNAHRFDTLGEFVAPDVEVNGTVCGVQEYGAGLAGVVEAFPDFRWHLEHLLIDGGWLSAHLIDTGTSTAGRSVTLQEFALYRTDHGRIAAVWGDLERERLGIT